MYKFFVCVSCILFVNQVQADNTLSKGTDSQLSESLQVDNFEGYLVGCGCGGGRRGSDEIPPDEDN